MTNITDKDREAAASIAYDFDIFNEDDPEMIARIFARHREEARAEGMREAAGIADDHITDNERSVAAASARLTARNIADAIRNAIEGKE